MDKPETPRSMEPQCVGKLEIGSAKPDGFLCGSIPVPTDHASHDFDPSGLIPATRTVQAPRYRIIPTETDLNMLPIPEKVFPVIPAQSRTFEDIPMGNRTITSNLSRKDEALAISGLADDGDELDVIAPVDILKQIFKIPYSKDQVSIAVRRVGRTLVLNVGPDFEVGEKLVRRHNKTAKCTDESLFLKFAMHSVRMEACDCPPSYHPAQNDKPVSHVVPGQFDSREEPLEASELREHVSSGRNSYIAKDEGFSHRPDLRSKKAEVLPVKKNSKRNKASNAVKKVSQVEENSQSSMQESEKCRRASTDGFLRLLFWQFHNFRMLLGSDLLILSNEKFVAVSLHLWDVSRQVTPLTWLEVWLDNVMASVPELAICYHQDGVVQGYEHIKTEDIFLLKGVAEDGTPAFLPNVIKQNGDTVLRFLQENCKQDPGVYWLYKSAGEDVMKLLNISEMPKPCHGDDSDDAGSVLPDLIYNGLLSLGTLLYRVAHRLSLSMSPDRIARGVRFFRQCLDFLDGPHHLVVRALAHEQLARLLLLPDKKLQLASNVLPIDSEVLYGDKGDSSEVITASIHDVSVSYLADSAGHVMSPNIPNPISKKRDAIYHACEAIKLISSSRNSQSVEPVICACGNADCFEVCKISEWLPTPNADEKSWELVLLLGESYLALGQAYRDEGQLFEAFRAVELACLVYGSMPKLENKKFDSCSSSSLLEISGISDETRSLTENKKFDSSISSIQLEDKTISLIADDFSGNEQLSTNSPFWSRAWALVGDLYADFHETWRKFNRLSSEKNSCFEELKVSCEVLEEIQRLNLNREQPSPKCTYCSLLNCSCERAKTGSSASSSSGSDLTKRIKKRSSKGSSSVISSEIDNSKTSHAIEETGERGGIFKYIKNPPEMGDGDGVNLGNAIECYEEARKVLLKQNPVCLGDYKLLAKKKGWFGNLLSQRRMARGELDEAESAFADAIVSLKETGDNAYIGVINYKMALQMRKSAGANESTADALKGDDMLGEERTKALERAKKQYYKSLSYYRTAKMELDALDDSDSKSLRDEAHSQFAHTYLRLAGLLAKYDSIDEVYVNEAISKALALYESSLSDSREEDAAYAYFHLALFQRDQCLKLLDSVTRSDEVTRRIMDYAEQAHSSWQKSLECFGPATHTRTYLAIVIEQSDLPLKISKSLHLPKLMETALTRLFEGRRVSEIESLSSDNKDVCEKFWELLRGLLKEMLATATKAPENSTGIVKLREIYRRSLRATDFSELHAIHTLWLS